MCHGFVKIVNLVIDVLKKLCDFGLNLFKWTFLEQIHNAINKQYLDKNQRIDVELDPHIVQVLKPFKGFMKSLITLSTNIMASYSTGQWVKTAKVTNVTKSSFLTMVEETFDGKVFFYQWHYSNMAKHIYGLILFSIQISWQLFQCFKRFINGYRRCNHVLLKSIRKCSYYMLTCNFEQSIMMPTTVKYKKTSQWCSKQCSSGWY